MSSDAGMGLDEETTRLLIHSVVGFAIYRLDPAGNVVSWNPGAERIKGYASGEILGKHYECFYTPEAREAGVPQRDLDLAREGPYETEGWRVRKGGERFWASLTVTPLVDEAGVLRGYAKVTRDLTESRRAQEEHARALRAREALRLRDEYLEQAYRSLNQVLASIRIHVRTLEETVQVTSRDSAPALSAKLKTLEWGLDRLAVLTQNVLQLAADTGERLLAASKG